MTPPDDPTRSPAPPPEAEFRADYDGIRMIARAALAGAVLAALYLLYTMSGIGAGSSGSIDPPALSTPTMDANYGTAGYISPSNALANDLWKWSWFFGLISVLVSIWHVLRGSGGTRLLLKVLLVGWMIWTCAGVALSWDSRSRSTELSGDYEEYKSYGGKTLQLRSESQSKSDGSWIKFVLLGLGCGAFVGLVMRREPQPLDFAGFARHGEPQPIAGVRWGSTQSRPVEWTSEFDIGAFRVWSYIGIVIGTFLPAILDGIFGAEGFVYAFTIWLTFPAWIIISPWSRGVEEGALAFFMAWAAISLLLCLWHLRYPSPGKGTLLLFNHVVAALFVWASLPHMASQGSYLHAGLIFGCATLIALFGGILICIPLSRVRIGGPAAETAATPIELAPGMIVESYAAFCPACGQQVHARNGQCLYCGGGVQAV